MRHLKESLEKIYPKKQTDCDKCREQLFDFVSDAVDLTHSKWIEEHLRQCTSCQTEFQEIKKMLQVLEEDPEPRIPENFQSTLHLKLAQAAEEMNAARSRSFRERAAHWMEPNTWKDAFLGFGNGTFRNKIEHFGQLGGWKVMAPAMVCLTLTIGVFSTGLYQSWIEADGVLTAEYEVEDSVKQTEKPRSTKRPSSAFSSVPKTTSVPRATSSVSAGGASSVPRSTVKARATARPTATVRPYAKATAKATAKTTLRPTATPRPTVKPTEAQLVEDPGAAPMPESEILAESAVPILEKEQDNAAVHATDSKSDKGGAVKAMGGGSADAPVNDGVNAILEGNSESSVFLNEGRAAEAEQMEAAQEFEEKVYLIRVDDAEEYLEEYQKVSGLDWEQREIEYEDRSILLDEEEEESIVLQISDEEWEDFSAYTLEKGILPRLLHPEGRERTIVVILTEYED